MSAARDQAIIDELRANREELRAIRTALTAAHAPRSGPITTPVACSILGCGKTTLYELLGEGKVKRAAMKLGKESTFDAASIWAFRESLTPPPPRPRRKRAANETEAEAIGKIPID